jgi:RHS repeat-associated protein
MYKNIKSLTKKWVCNYNPSTGRFLSEDPIGFSSGDLNLYRYVNNSPVIYTDPLGRWGFVGAAIGAVSGTVGGYMTGGLQGAIIGGVVGGAIGLVAPQFSGAVASTVVTGITGVASSIGGQMAGNFVCGKDLTSNLNYAAAAGAGVGAAGAVAAGSGYIAGAFFNKGLGVAAQGFAEGLFTGGGELGGKVLGGFLGF